MNGVNFLKSKNYRISKFLSKHLPNYICMHCATELGGELLNDKVDFNLDFCPRCESFLPLTQSKNWIWPEQINRK